MVSPNLTHCSNSSRASRRVVRAVRICEDRDMPLQHFIDAWKSSARCGASRCFAPRSSPWVVGRMDENQIVLRSGLSQEQQLLTLVHELTHFLAHRPEHDSIARYASTKPRRWRNWFQVSWVLKAWAPDRPDYRHGRSAGLLRDARALGGSHSPNGSPRPKIRGAYRRKLATGASRHRDLDSAR